MFLRRLAGLGASVLLLGGCGGGGGPSKSATTTETSTSCSAATGQYAGPTSENLCVAVERSASGDISLFKIETLATCSAGFSEPQVTVKDVTGPQTLTTSEAPSNPNKEFQATVSITPPITVGADGTFKVDNVSGTISDADASGSYLLQLAGFARTATGVGTFTCTGSQVTWKATAQG